MPVVGCARPIGAAGAMTSFSIEAWAESWPIACSFSIARASKREAAVFVARLSDGTIAGRGECVPYARYGETIESVRGAIETVAPDGLDRQTLARRLPAGAARNALDCALWDYEAKRSGRSAASLAGVGPPGPATTAHAMSVGASEALA